MQLAERWLGFGTIAAAVVLVHVAVLVPHGHTHRNRHHHHHHHSVDLAPHNCTDGPRMVAPPPVVEPAPPPVVESPPPTEPALGPDRYAMVFEHAHAQFQRCFTTETRVDLLISIAADGRVTSVSHRPGPSTPASRCLEPIVKQLRFPPGDMAIATRVLLTSE